MQNDNPQLPEDGNQPGSSLNTESQQPDNGRAKTHIKKLNIFAGKGKYEAVILIIVIAAIAGGAFYYGRNSKHSEKSSQKTVQVAVSAPAGGSTTQSLPEAEFLSGNTYLSSPQKLGDLGFLKDYKALGCDTGCDVSDLDIAYYQIGSTSDGNKIVVMTYLSGPGGDQYLFAIQKGNAYSLLAQNSNDPANFGANWTQSLNPNATVDYKTKLDDIKMPLQATVSNQKMKVRFAPDGATALTMDWMNMMKNGLSSIRGGFFSEVPQSAVKKLGSQNNIDFYEVTANDSANYSVMELYGAYKQLFSGDYGPAGEIANTNGNLNVKWTSGNNNSSTYFSAGAGCGSTGYVIAKNINPSALIKVGTTPGGQTVYQLPKNNALVQEIYTKDYSNGDDVDSQSLKNLSLDQFTSQHGYFLAKNGLGEYVLFLRDDLIIRGGCAKPVVYLYPQQKQQVSVKVGAKVVNSDPAYGSGWDNVTAYPDGSLSYNGKVYGNLFWDGYGDGIYPPTDFGTIVRTSDVISTVRSQLKQQGLNGQEITDFMAYWSPKLNAISQPYTRLTWFNTGQMNQLAPLQISPAPQTLIRVFLDFQGISKPYSLKPQHLSSVNRSGFTAVEWGGLARNGLN